MVKRIDQVIIEIFVQQQACKGPAHFKLSVKFIISKKIKNLQLRNNNGSSKKPRVNNERINIEKFSENFEKS